MLGHKTKSARGPVNLRPVHAMGLVSPLDVHAQGVVAGVLVEDLVKGIAIADQFHALSQGQSFNDLHIGT